MLLIALASSLQRRFFLWAAIFCIALAGCNKDSEKKHASAEAVPAVAVLPPSDHAGKFAPGDLLDVRCMDLMAPGVETSTPSRVASDGTVSLPYVGKVKVAGLTHRQAEGAISKAYKDANLVENLQVYIRRLMVASEAPRTSGIIGNYDLVRISFGDVTAPGTELVRVVRVEPDGTVAVPYATSVKIAGLTEDKAAAAISAEYQQHDDLSRVPTSVLILEAAPPDAATRDLPDRPLGSYPPIMAPLFEPSMPEMPISVQSATPKK
ncbi:MAG TPA: polysaccharide biosynthesis/export family protein [Tepidisphaeraceae bacterium]|jgi:protein involved in polysaccharide export with SLBB domain|nr:polysaccharide biosynthesis/export family protein [Tepidisphaeraceae bacterium]